MKFIFFTTLSALLAFTLFPHQAHAQESVKCGHRSDNQANQTFYDSLFYFLQLPKYTSHESNPPDKDSKVYKDLVNLMKQPKYRKDKSRNQDKITVASALYVVKNLLRNPYYAHFDSFEGLYFDCDRSAFREAVEKSTTVQVVNNKYEFEISWQQLHTEGLAYRVQKSLPALSVEQLQNMKTAYDGVRVFGLSYIGCEVGNASGCLKSDIFSLYLFGKPFDDLVEDLQSKASPAPAAASSSVDNDESEDDDTE